MYKKEAFLLLALAALSICCYSSTITLQSGVEEYIILSNRIEIFEDTSGSIPFEELSAQPEKYRFTRYDKSEMLNIPPSHVYWMRFKINNNSGTNKWVLEILDSRFDELVFYAPDEKNQGNYIKSVTGTRHPFLQREYEHKNFVFDIPFVSAPDTWYYIKIDSRLVGSFLFKIRKNKIFSSYGFKEYLLLGMYYGILLIMAFYNLFLYFSIREKAYIYYFFYVLTWACNSATEDGLGFQFIWSELPYIPLVGLYAFRIILLAFYILYAQTFLDVNNNLPRFKNRLYYLLLFYSVLNILFTWLHLAIPQNLLFIFTFSYILYLSYLIYRNGYKPARFFLLGNSVIVGGLILNLLKNEAIFNHLLEDAPGLLTIMVYIKNISMILDIVILSIALGDRIRYLKDTTEKAQQKIIDQLNINQELTEKINKDLEKKVDERTRTIEEKNKLLENAYAQLKQQAEEINKMNAILDLDNWNLKKNIIEEKEARIILKEINYKEFQQVYPNEATCLNYLEELKWAKGYKCRKCNNEKFTKGLSTLSRRCSKCRYDESITAYTIFHRCKFDINKAMYITAMINRYGDSVTVADISRELEVRNATCWKFYQKVLSVRSRKEFDKVNDNEKLKYLILNG